MNTFRERPILMNGESVLGIIDLRKTQTRRVVKGKIALDWLQPGMFSLQYVALPENYLSPFGYAGNLLWVRETWAPELWDNDNPQKGDPIIYRADMCGEALDYPWRPSIFMPRWASRLTLEIINLHIEKLNDITEADVLAEGIIRSNDGNYLGLNGYPFQYAYEAYFSVWNSIYTKKGYPSDSNPWVWVYEFKPIDQPAVNGD